MGYGLVKLKELLKAAQAEKQQKIETQRRSKRKGKKWENSLPNSKGLIINWPLMLFSTSVWPSHYCCLFGQILTTVFSKTRRSLKFTLLITYWLFGLTVYYNINKACYFYKYSNGQNFLPSKNTTTKKVWYGAFNMRENLNVSWCY